jgi:hypothetical protein
MQRNVLLLKRSLAANCEQTRARAKSRSRADGRPSTLLALLGALSLVPACSLVVGDEPHARDAGREPDEDAESPDADAPEDSSMRDAALVREDAGSIMATSDAGSPTTMEAAVVDANGVGSDAGVPDAAPSEAGPMGCANGGQFWYPDGDNDGFGRSNESLRACTKPSGAWVPQGGDCKDNNGDVHPEQLTYFEMGYVGGDGNESFDYDCSGSEDGNPGQRPLPTGCGILDLLTCEGTGYMSQPRTGPGVNPVCGSDKIGTCTPMLLSCTTATEMTMSRYRCR